jgi:hypothetical protein
MVIETISPQQRDRVHPKGRTMKICIANVSHTMKTTTTSWPKRTDKIDIKDAQQKKIGQH